MVLSLDIFRGTCRNIWECAQVAIAVRWSLESTVPQRCRPGTASARKADELENQRLKTRSERARECGNQARSEPQLAIFADDQGTKMCAR